MTIRDIFNHILISSGCFRLEENVELKIHDFRRIVDESIAFMNKYDPDDRKISITTSKYEYTFTGAESPIEGSDTRIPRWISDVIPNTHPTQNVLNWVTIFGSVSPLQKQEFVWSYCSPHLFLDRNGRFEVHACYDHSVVPVYEGEGENKQIVDFSYPTITLTREPFFMLIRGKFMQAVGRYRRAFTLAELPLTMDAATIVQEGIAAEDNAKKSYFSDASKFYLAFQ
jgi:hypothetical protein